MRTSFAILALLASGSLAAATIYKWVDANGVTRAPEAASLVEA